jgi:hypothetical protein
MKLRHAVQTSGKVPIHAAKPDGHAYHLAADGTLDVPRWLVPELESRGFVRVDGSTHPIDTRAELAATTDPGELASFLEAHGVAPHYMDRFTHYHSAQLRALGKTSPVKTADGEELHEAAANALDSLHQSLHKSGVGRIVAMSIEEMRMKAIEIFNAGQKSRS